MKKITAFLCAAALFAAGCSKDGPGAAADLPPAAAPVLHGNVDTRQLDLAFLISERIAKLVPEEGTLVKKGDLLGELETVRLENDLAAARAEVAARAAGVKASLALYEKAKNGPRVEDIAIARAGNAALAAKSKAAELNYKRKKDVIPGAVAQQTLDDAESQYLFMSAGLKAVGSYLDKLLAGERKEDIAAAAAQYEQAEAALVRAKAEVTIREQRIKDTKLYAPCDGIIRSRLLEPGELASPQKAALSLAVTSPKWVRAYLPETALLAVKEGAKAEVRFDGASKPFPGWVGFVSPTAEFTPKNIETEELRPTLVYETRIYVEDPQNLLKLGAPATVTFPAAAAQ